MSDKQRSVVFSADDFGLSVGVNQAVERAFREGVLTQASLMMAGPAGADAVARAKANPDLKIGLHLVVIEGPAVLRCPSLVDVDGQFPSGQLPLGIKYFFNRSARRQLREEITAQFRAFAATGLTLHHADAHKHMHLHPTVGRTMLEVGRAFGLARIRIPAEPPVIMSRLGEKPGFGDRALYHWSSVLRAQAARLGVATNDYLFGLRWTGRMTEDRVLRLLELLPAGESEIYFHPAVARDNLLHRLMPDYDHEAELRALLSSAVRAAAKAIS